MSLMGRLARPRNEVITSSADLEKALRRQGMETDSGAVVNSETAMRVSTVYTCVRVVSEGIAQINCITYRRDGRAKNRATDHWLYPILHDQANPFQTAFEYFEMAEAHLLLGGGHYAFSTVVRGELRELLPLPPWRVKPRLEHDWRVIYDVTMPDGSVTPFGPDRIFHVRGLSLDGVNGLSVLDYQRETIGLAMQMRKHGARMFKNGAMPGGTLEHPQVLSPEAGERLRAQFDERYSGTDNAWKTLLLEEGMKYSKQGMTSEELQFLESMKFQRSEIAGIFRVPPHMVGDLERATFSNIEHQSLEFVKFCLGPWLRRWEQRIAMSLIPERERSTVFVEFLPAALLRGDTPSRFTAYGQAIKDGWMSRNEVRQAENLNPEEGLDEFLEPLNMTPAGTERGADGKPATDPQPNPGGDPADQRSAA